MKSTTPLKTLSLIIISSLTLASVAMADCKEAYNNEIKRLDGMLNPSRTAFATSGATAIAVPVTLIATGATITAGGIIAAPAAAAGAGIFYAYVGGRRLALRRALALIKNAEKGTGPLLSKFTNQMQKFDASLTEETVAAAIANANKENAFCSETALGRSKVKGLFMVKKLVKARLLGADQTETASLEEVDSDEDQI